MSNVFKKYSIFFGIFILTLFLFSGCNRYFPALGVWYSGDVFAISVFDFVRIENLSFTGEDKSFDIKSDHGLEFIALKLVILNPRTSMVEFNINQESMELYSDLLENKKYIPYNVLEFESNPKENGDNKPKKRLYREEILWGNYSLSLEQEMEGWVFFQVPKGQQFELLLWKTADIVKITK
tara:strand:- start:68 stop:610 length:543 start_codon:yes stop_codon:yes gene_type:complete